MESKKPYSTIFSLNFQLQAVVFIVALGSMAVFGVLFRVLSEISEETNLLSKAVELNSNLEDWKNELSNGARSRIKYVTLRKNIYLRNYQNSLLRINSISLDIQNLSEELGEFVETPLTVLWDKQSKYQGLSTSFEIEIQNPEQLESIILLLEEEEKELKLGIDHFLREVMGNYRNNKLDTIENIIASSTNLVFGLAAVFILVTIVIWLLLRRKILLPLKVLERGAKRIGEGELGLQVEVDTKGEIRDLVEVLNKMSTQLKSNQDAQIMLQKLETIGQVAVSVNHEINNPLQIIMGNAEFLNKLLENKDEVVNKKLKSILTEVRRISEVTKKLRDIKNPVVETYVSEEATMIDINKSS